MLGYLLATLVHRQAKIRSGYTGSLNHLLETLNNIRLGTLLEASSTPSKTKAVYKLEEMTEEEQKILQSLTIENIHHQRPQLQGVGAYS